MTTFLEAHRILGEFSGGQDLPFLFAMSGTPDPLRLYLQAAGALRGRRAQPRFLPFNTLPQHLATSPPGGAEAYLLMPWDFVPEADWRSGVSPHRISLSQALERGDRLAEQLRGRAERGARLLYLPAQTPPAVGFPAGERSLGNQLDSLAASLGARAIPAEAFSLASYFSSGCPVGGAWLSRVAEVAVEALTVARPAAAKVLVTDLDDTLWSGVIAEEGPGGIGFGPEGSGYRHYLYQTMLARLRREGIVLAAVSRNDPEIALAPFRSGLMPLGEADFVTIIASYHAKSAQVRQLADQLNLGLDSFVYVDNNPVELEEIKTALPQVRVLGFPEHDEGLTELFGQLTELFGRPELTAEDRDRTELYRRRLEGLVPAHVEGADLTRFLTELNMHLQVHDRSRGDRTRAIQLINKTNQFNANGRRWSAEEITSVIDRGGRLLGASLADRSGNHGEILACLLGPDGTIEAFLMSCRVFQRRVEFAFLVSLAQRDILPTGIRFAVTERNEPFRLFAGSDPAFGPAENGILPWKAREFAQRHSADLELFEVTWD